MAGCGGGSTPPAAPPPPPAVPATQGDPQSSCDGLALAWLAADTTTDTGPDAARHRAAEQYGTPRLQQQIGDADPTRPDAQWSEWSAHRARIITATGTYNGEAPPTPGEGDRGRFAATLTTRTATGADGWNSPLPDVVVYCTLVEQAGQWRVDDLQTGIAQ
ncbi:hypothetical protein [Saccharopolyspora pogona]|uniref:hypothetical protein n=1 Tax=Saccharopolyspora pogona TaxID=333966 RepID=UPI00168314FD|nr:hypothetical protein [Saccharopolyspora pogona]